MNLREFRKQLAELAADSDGELPVKVLTAEGMFDCLAVTSGSDFRTGVRDRALVWERERYIYDNCRSKEDEEETLPINIKQAISHIDFVMSENKEADSLPVLVATSYGDVALLTVYRSPDSIVVQTPSEKEV